MIRVVAASLALIVSLLVGACASGGRDTAGRSPLAARFHLEATPGENGVIVALPVSGVRIAVAPKPVLTEYDIASAAVAQVELGRCLALQLTPAAGRDLQRLAVIAAGRRLVLSLNGEFLGARAIDAALAEGAMLVFVEVPDERLPEIVAGVQAASAALGRSTSRLPRS